MASQYRQSQYTAGHTDSGSFYSVNSLNTEYMELLTVTTPNELLRKFCPPSCLAQLAVASCAFLKLFLIYYSFSYTALYAHLIYKLFAQIPLAVFTAPVNGGRFLLYKIIDSRQYKLDASTSVATLLWVLSVFGGIIGWVCFLVTLPYYKPLIGDLYDSVRKYEQPMAYCLLLQGLCDSVRELILKQRFYFDFVIAAVQCFAIAVGGAIWTFNRVYSDNYLIFLAFVEYALPFLVYIASYYQIFTFTQALGQNNIYQIHFRFRLLFPIKYKMVFTFIANAFHALFQQTIYDVFTCLLLFTSYQKRLTDPVLAQTEKLATLIYLEIIRIGLSINYALKTLFFECVMFARFTNKASMVPRIQQKLLLYWVVYSFAACIVLLFAGPFMYDQLVGSDNALREDFQRYEQDLKHIGIVCFFYPVVSIFYAFTQAANNLLPSIFALICSFLTAAALVLTIQRNSRINYIQIAYIQSYAEILINLPFTIVYYIRQRREPEYRIQPYNYQPESRNSLAPSSHLSYIQQANAFYDSGPKSSFFINSTEMHQTVPTVNQGSVSQSINVLAQNSMETSFKQVSKLESFAPFSYNDSKDSGNDKSHGTNEGESK